MIRAAQGSATTSTLSQAKDFPAITTSQSNNDPILIMTFINMKTLGATTVPCAHEGLSSATLMGSLDQTLRMEAAVRIVSINLKH